MQLTIGLVLPLSGQSDEVNVTVEVVETAGDTPPLQVQEIVAYGVDAVSPSTSAVVLNPASEQLAPPLLALLAGIEMLTSHPAGLLFVIFTVPVLVELIAMIVADVRLVIEPAGTLDSPIASDIRPAGMTSPPVSVDADRPVTIENVSLSATLL